jgi:hypothetical protein
MSACTRGNTIEKVGEVDVEAGLGVFIRKNLGILLFNLNEGGLLEDDIQTHPR